MKTPEYYTNEKTYPTQPCLTLDPAAAIQGSDIWAAADLVGADWHTATNATVEEADGKYLITLPESEGNFISVGKPAFLGQ